MQITPPMRTGGFELQRITVNAPSNYDLRGRRDEAIYSSWASMRIWITPVGCRTLIGVFCLVLVAGCIVLAQSAAEGQFPSNPQPQASPKAPASPPTPRTAPSSAPSTAVKDAAAADGKAEIIIPAAAERHYHAGRMAEKEKDSETAIAEYRAAIKEYPDYVDARYRLANLLMDHQGYNEAIAELRQVVMLRPNDANEIGRAHV